MAKSSQQRPRGSSHVRLGTQGLVRFEVVGLVGDREQIRAIARRLSADGPDTAELRRNLAALVAGGGPTKGGILAALRRSPLVGAGIVVSRSRLRSKA